MVITAALVFSIVAFSIRNAVKGELHLARVEGYQTFFLSNFFLNWWLWIFEPLGKFLVRSRIDPNIITWMQLPVAVSAGLLFALGNFGMAGWIVCFGASLDFMDGLVARKTNKVTRSGGFLDSTLDRYVDFFILLGYAAYYRDSYLWLVPLLAILGSFTVPYIRAKGESMGVNPRVGGMQRGERIFFLGCPAALSPIAAAFLERGVEHPLHYLALAGVALVAVFANVTGILRGMHTMRALREQPIVLKETPAVPEKVVKAA
jgi:phosphatidylglycerophosphate synthase